MFGDKTYMQLKTSNSHLLTSFLSLLIQEMAVTEAWQLKGFADCNEKQAGWLKI